MTVAALVSKMATVFNEMYMINLEIVSAVFDGKVSPNDFSFARRPVSSADYCGDCESEDSSSYASAASDKESEYERADTVSVREGARVHFPCVNVVSEVRYRPWTDPLKKH